MEISNVRFPSPVRPLCLAAALALSACGSLDDVSGNSTIDYRTTGNKTAPLDIPPDLTQLSRDPRYAPQGASVSASSFQTGTAPAAPAATAATAASSAPAASAPAAPGAQVVAVNSGTNEAGVTKIERQGNERWLASPLTPEQMWPQLRSFWQELGMALVVDRPESGVMETDWAENRAKIPQDAIRAVIGKVFDSAYSTGERDKFRTRVERTPTGSDVFITMRGMIEVQTESDKSQTKWQPRPPDPQLEAEMLGRLLQKLTAKSPKAVSPAAAAAAASAPEPVARARMLEGRPAPTIQVDDGFDRAWRRVGLALDRSGFTVEDRDRVQGLYFVRYVDPAQAGKEEPNFVTKLFTSKSDAGAPVRYRVSVKAEGNVSLVTVLDNQGAPEKGEAAQSIMKLLLADLK
jgi:outer membrane protein assembly factor BamC